MLIYLGEQCCPKSNSRWAYATCVHFDLQSTQNYLWPRATTCIPPLMGILSFNWTMLACRCSNNATWKMQENIRNLLPLWDAMCSEEARVELMCSCVLATSATAGPLELTARSTPNTASSILPQVPLRSKPSSTNATMISGPFVPQVMLLWPRLSSWR